ncbi:guanine nucleotide-binding protein subunit alpha [Conoideocrella luteorostrata]|uniref:Guanine nucleotide-binding protein subunit alpha n=1 Tax=Conoideocrella luteorostrata TaxID=1105319 RepID=A0AAJ0FY11_9HYPO|nr:guanine nucleotide-binding protein subunit alpha [Conoideocrella luteorostrata]
MAANSSALPRLPAPLETKYDADSLDLKPTSSRNPQNQLPFSTRLLTVLCCSVSKLHNRHVLQKRWTSFRARRRSRAIDQYLCKEYTASLSNLTAVLLGTNSSNCHSLLHLVEAASGKNHDDTLTCAALEDAVRSRMERLLQIFLDLSLDSSFLEDISQQVVLAHRIIDNLHDRDALETTSDLVDQFFNDDVFHRVYRQELMCLPLDIAVINMKRLASQDPYFPTLLDRAFILEEKQKGALRRTQRFTKSSKELSLALISGDSLPRKKWASVMDGTLLAVVVFDMAKYGRSNEHREGTIDIDFTMWEHFLASQVLNHASTFVLVLCGAKEFASTLVTSPLSSFCPDYKGGNDTQAARQFVLDRFLSMAEEKQKTVHSFVGELHDPSLVPFLWNISLDIVRRKKDENTVSRFRRSRRIQVETANKSDRKSLKADRQKAE